MVSLLFKISFGTLSKQLAWHEILTTVWFSRLQIARNQQKKKRDVYMQYIFNVDANYKIPSKYFTPLIKFNS